MTTQKWLKKHTLPLTGKRIAVSGSTGGIGKQLCRHLACLGADMVLVDRDLDRSRAHGESLTADFPSIAVSYVTADLEDMCAVKAAAEQLKAMEIDSIILNAGAYHIPRHKCSTGYDNVFQINFVSPYYLARTLLPYIASKGGKIVAVGSIAHNYSVIDTNDVDFSTRARSSRVYGNAKRYLMYSLLGIGHKSIAITHPGITLTNITAHYPKPVFAIIKHPMKVIFMSPRRAALSVLAGLFTDTQKGQWIGPRCFNVWGTPKAKRLSTCSDEEASRICEITEEIFNSLNR